jgi:ketosteroid isomerase-like protein
MKNFLLIVFLFSLILGSCEPKKKYLSPQELELEKDKIKTVIEAFNNASEEKNFGKMVEYLDDEVIFFGTDSSEVIKTFADYKKAIDKQWQVYDRINYSDLRDVSIFIDDEANLATIFYGTNADVVKEGISNNYYLRGARILKKKNDKWLIVGGLTGIVRSAVEKSNNIVETDSTKVAK